MRDIKPEPCIVAECGHLGEVLIEKYAPTDRIGGVQTNGPTGEWIWLCGRHVVPTRHQPAGS